MVSSLLQNKKFVWATLAVLFAVVLFGIVLPAINASAQPCLEPECANQDTEFKKVEGKQLAATQPSTGSKFGCSWLTSPISCSLYLILDTLSDVIVTVFVFFAEAMFDTTVKMQNVNLANIQFVQLGWSITRDVANLFFVFFLLWTAIATIFNFEAYSARRTLPRLIAAALLINFSLPIGNFVIQTSNAIAGVFYDSLIKDPFKNPTAEGGDSIAAKIRAISKFSMVVGGPADARQNAAMSNSALPAFIRSNCPPTEWKDTIRGRAAVVAQCASTFFWGAFNKVFGYSSSDAAKDQQNLSPAFAAIFWKLALTPVIVFVLFAGSLFLLIRMISLAFVLVLGPLAFLFMILPYTQSHYNRWWESLVKWSFFFPAFMFFLYLSLEGGSLVLTATMGGKNNLFAAGFSYLLVMGFLIASLLVAQQMGIAMAGTIVGLGRRAVRSAGRAARRKAWRGTRKLASETTKALKVRIPESGFAKPFAAVAERTLGRIQAAGKQADKERYSAQYGYLRNLPDKDKGRYVSQMSARDQASALKDMGATSRAEVVSTLNASDQIRMMQKLRSDANTRGQERLIGDATNNPEVRALIEDETLTRNVNSKEYQDKVMKSLREMNKKNLSAEFMRTSPVWAKYQKESLKSDEIEQMLKSDKPETRSTTAGVLRPYLQATDAINDQQSKLTEQIRNTLKSEGLHETDAAKIAGEIVAKDANKTEDIEKVLTEQMKAAGMDADKIDGHIRVALPGIVQSVENSRRVVTQLKQDRDAIPLSEGAKQYATTSPGQVIIKGGTPVILEGGQSQSWKVREGGGVDVNRGALTDAVREYFSNANVSGMSNNDVQRITEAIKDNLANQKSGGKIDTKLLAQEIERHRAVNHPDKEIDTEAMAESLKNELGLEEKG
ncbi:MAG: hypothetical protein UX72_C0021G0038 [Parcubacteria group bacterium GW2011_GWA2_47_10]|nr:MAG: hypothetical protein UX72_C0021G0038 [Parcubacteria group bacterium GW2011_GWA2_47_10]OGZ98462.1 MAG: hypothetical protein A3D57_05555 [Candidatus Sungbacteria bacterium RIFCSPHIGHO2_02_FULL_46_12]